MAKLVLSESAESFIYNAIDSIINSSEPTHIKQRNFGALLDMSPHAEWVEIHPSIKTHAYMPISRVEGLMRLFFGISWEVEVLQVQQLFNAVQVSVRVHYTCPITGRERKHDGVGAKELQTASGSGVLKMDFSNVNKSAVEMAVGIAKSTAIKDACDMIGRIFGSDINRKNTLSQSTATIANEAWQVFKPELADNVLLRNKVKNLLASAETVEELGNVWKNQVVPTVKQAGAHENNFVAFAKEAKDKLNAKLEIATTPTNNPQNADVGELTEKQLAVLQIQQADNE